MPSGSRRSTEKLRFVRFDEANTGLTPSGPPPAMTRKRSGRCGRLDADDVGAVLAEQAGDLRRRAGDAEVEDPHARERPGAGGVTLEGGLGRDRLAGPRDRLVLQRRRRRAVADALAVEAVEAGRHGSLHAGRDLAVGERLRAPRYCSASSTSRGRSNGVIGMRRVLALLRRLDHRLVGEELDEHRLDDVLEDPVPVGPDVPVGVLQHLRLAQPGPHLVPLRRRHDRRADPPVLARDDRVDRCHRRCGSGCRQRCPSWR